MSPSIPDPQIHPQPSSLPSDGHDISPPDIADAGLVAAPAAPEPVSRSDQEGLYNEPEIGQVAALGNTRARVVDVALGPGDKKAGAQAGSNNVLHSVPGLSKDGSKGDAEKSTRFAGKSSTSTAGSLSEDDLSTAHSHIKENVESSSPPETYQTGTGKLKDLSGSEQHLESTWKKRDHWYQLWRPRNYPTPAPRSLDSADEIPLATANILSQLTFWWVTPLMVLGYQRPLQATDLWKMDSTREAGYLSERFKQAYQKRTELAAEWNAQLVDPTNPLPVPRKTRIAWSLKSRLRRPVPGQGGAASTGGLSHAEKMRAYEEDWRTNSGRKAPSIIWSVDDIMVGFWVGGLFKVVGDTCTLMSPLVTKALITFASETYAAQQAGTEPPSIGRGVGLAIVLFCLTIGASVAQHQFFFRSMAMGVLARAALITATYQRTMFLTVKSRAMHPNGKIMSHLSADISRIDFCAQWFHAIWTAPIQLIITMILLILQIGPSALLGMSLFLMVTPLQTWFMKTSYRVRQSSMIWTDARSKLLQELLQSMAIIKQFTNEIPFLKRLSSFRKNELRGIRVIVIIRAANQALAFSIPVLASIVSFSCYAGIGHTLEAATIFTALSYFMLLRQPLMFLPRALSSLTDAQNALQRLKTLYEADYHEYELQIEPGLDVAIRAEDWSVQWVTGAEESLSKKDKKKLAKGEKEEKTISRPGTPVDEPFRLETTSFDIPKGLLVGIVGSIGSGKSSLLQGMIGDMQLVSGSVKFGGSVAYCQQTAWIQNLSLRENILFGHPWDEKRYWQAIQDAALPSDLVLLPDGDLTEIGEKGLNLSGGQRQRINIARALYADSDIILLDDPLSAVDGHVGRHLFNEAIVKLKTRGKTVLLVTHALHFLPQVDYILAIEDGRIAERGTYDELIAQKGTFSRLIEEFGGAEEESKEAEEEEATEVLDLPKTPARQLMEQVTQQSLKAAAGTGRLEGRLMVSEKRETGKVNKSIYKSYLTAGKAKYTGPVTLAAAILMQCAQVASTVWLTYWERDTFNQSSSFYMGIYAFLGIAQAIFTFALGGCIGTLSFYASGNLYDGALKNLFFAPMRVFDTTPTGRIMGVFGKDIDTIDNLLADSLRMFLMTISSVLGSIVIITVYLHYFIPVVVVVFFGYIYFAMFYRASAREVKRLDAMTRSLLYSHFGETLSGLATIRAYSATTRFFQENCYYMDLEDRAYMLVSANQRWLAVRLDFMGACLIFAVAIMAAKGGAGLSASTIGLCLTYLVSMVQMMTMVMRQTAELENNMNSVERVVHYGASIPQENPHHIPGTEPSKEWPQTGKIEFKDVVMSYRDGLDPVLKKVSFSINPGERVGIIGRTGAGKSSLTIALYRLVELSRGSITIDDVDISTLGLNTLRSKIAIIPQSPVLFSGTIRSNLDPFGAWDDHHLFEAMRRACLLTPTSTEDGLNEKGEEARQRFSLDTVVEDEGANLSVGERSLVSLARAIVKDAGIVVLDEATSSVDIETDEKIQATIRKEFGGRILIAIAHRLRTILSWDRILVMDKGEVSEFDTPLNLFDKGDESIFRSLCEGSHITRAEIEKAQLGEARRPSEA